MRSEPRSAIQTRGRKARLSENQGRRNDGIGMSNGHQKTKNVGFGLRRRDLLIDMSDGHQKNVNISCGLRRRQLLIGMSDGHHQIKTDGFGLQRRHLLIGMSDGHQKTDNDGFVLHKTLNFIFPLRGSICICARLSFCVRLVSLVVRSVV